MSNLKTAKFVCVSVDDGKTAQSNKYYHMFEQANGTFKVEYGRVEKTKQHEEYPMDLWEKKMKEKLKKGYKDVTSLFSEIVTTSATGKVQSFSDITNRQVKQLIDELQAHAKRTVKANYTISADKVTEAQVNAAQAIVDQIAGLVKIGTRAGNINPLLLELYTIIPREMSNVKDHIFADITSKSDLQNAKTKLDNEQSTLDAMSGQVALNKAQTKAADPKAVTKTMTMLDAMGLEISDCDSKDVVMIKKLMGPNANQFKNAFRVKNTKTHGKFESRVKNADNKKTELFFHGSRNCNYFNILETGLLITPAGVVTNGKMFGAGCYFSDKAQKSLNYTSLSGSYYAKGNDTKAYLMLFDVHIGNPKHITNHTSDCYNLNESQLKKSGHDSVFAHGGADLRNNEYIVYNINQSTIRFIIEVV